MARMADIAANTRPCTLAELKASGWKSVPVRTEIRNNVLAKIASREPIIDGVMGYEATVIPQLENALLAGHDIIFLGERGQAKSRIIRSLVNLLDEAIPIVAGSEMNDDPFHPVSLYARDLVAEHGDLTPITWIGPEDRYGEKLATPDTSIADLIGEVDPIKIAEGRYLSDELTIHYGLVPRTNRGIFAINELPDLAERIQVGLLNILEERDVQIRGHRVRLPVDVLLVASANPDDYTNRGRIITPLKDRFGTQIRTHYPVEIATEVAIVEHEVNAPLFGDVTIVMPGYLKEVLARVSQLARSSQRISQRSGVSVRATIANYETLIAASVGRAVRLKEDIAVARPSDLVAIMPSTIGKVEIEALEHDDDEEIIQALINTALVQTFKDCVEIERLGKVIGSFEDGLTVEVGAEVPSQNYLRYLDELPELNEIIAPLGGTSVPEKASAVEFVLEGLYLSRRLNKDLLDNTVSYRAR
jgi:magnesium chelatase subunit I